MEIKAFLLNVAVLAATAAAVIKIVLLEYESIRRVLEHVRRKPPASPPTHES
jgi:hypothetical protein